MENRIDKIMEEYKEELKKIDEKYEVKQLEELNLLDTKEVDEKIKYEEAFIQKLEFESENINKDLIAKAKERLKKAIDEKEQIKKENEKNEETYENAQARRETEVTEMNKLKNSKVILASGREVTQAEKDKMDKNELKNKAIKELTQESQKISSEIQIRKLEYDEKNKKMAELENEFIEKEDGTKIFIAGEEYKKIYEESKELKKQLNDLNNMQEKCDEYLKELKSPTKEFETFVKTWNEVYNIEPQPAEIPQAEVQPTEIQQAEVQSVETQPVETQQSKMSIEVRVSKDGGLDYIFTDLKNESSIVSKTPDEINIRNYRKQLKQLSEKYNIDKKTLKKIDPYLLSSIDSNFEENIILYAKGLENKLNEVKITYDMKDMSKLGVVKKAILRRIAKGAEKNGFEVKNLQKGILGRVADKIKNSISYAKLLSSAEPNKYLEEARNKGRIKDEIKEEMDYNEIRREECLDNFRDKYKYEYTEEQKRKIGEKVNAIKEEKKNGKEQNINVEFENDSDELQQ